MKEEGFINVSEVEVELGLRVIRRQPNIFVY
jgi:hypothetical protein